MAKKRKRTTTKKQKKIIRLLIVANIFFLAIIVGLVVMIYKKSILDKNTTKQTFTHIKATGDFVVCVDAGHGGNDVGALGNDGGYEKDDNLKLAKAVKKQLEANGVKVIMTRSDDSDTDLSNRSVIANEANADLFLSLHRNSAENHEAQGVEAWIHSYNTEASNAVATEILSAMEKIGVSENRGVRSGTQGSEETNYAVIRETKMTSLILETGFVSNDQDIKLLNDHMDEYANAIANAVTKWLNEYK